MGYGQRHDQDMAGYGRVWQGMGYDQRHDQDMAGDIEYIHRVGCRV